MLRTTADESIVDPLGRVIYFSVSRFIAEIAQGGHCFVCGASPDAVPFNDEHILSDWILRKFQLHSRVVTLPNHTPFRYGQFKIPCCVDCNTRMGGAFEEPMSRMFEGGYDHFCREITRVGAPFVFSWMCRLFLKTHLKDTYLRFHRDERKEATKIGELYSWEDLHHIHCVARSFYTGAVLNPAVIGSLFIMPAKKLPYAESFDYFDLTFAQTMLLRIDEVAVIAVLNDCRGSLGAINEILGKITGPLSPPQLREVAVLSAVVNAHLAERPKFYSDINRLTEEVRIGAECPAEFKVEGYTDDEFGNVMYHVCGPIVPRFPDREQLLANIRTGHYSFIFDKDGKFLTDHMELMTPTED